MNFYDFATAHPWWTTLWIAMLWPFAYAIRGTINVTTHKTDNRREGYNVCSKVNQPEEKK